MAWTTPRTWVAGETITAAIMNTHVRDNLVDVNNAPRWFGTGGIDTGALVAPLLLQSGTASVANAAGGTTINFPFTFPNGLVAPFVTLNGGGRADITGSSQVGIIVKNYNTAGTQLTTGTSFVFWLAVGC
ncbi:MAG TPA: hypothetical protein VGH54_10225 [Mycobacterium sp.]|jgi:hypothetical protein|uniref:gp53-like domain-containing protein n=1 Tax=Mycobacterium sp. TaxID=1785 RepID=UPI002F3EBB4C